jgi:hypothetical protein
LSEEDKTKQEPREKRLLVLEEIGKHVKRYRLPQTPYAEFARARPQSVKNGLTRQAATIEEEIGAWQIADGTLWFAKTFYDGEGYTGTGGFGYFDTEARQYRIESPPEIADWSASAMLVQGDLVWISLSHRGEYGGAGGGLLRFDRNSRKAEVIRTDDIASEMALVGGHVLLATHFGAAVIDGSKLLRYFVDRTTDGRLRVAEALPAE